jgi:hypothetical protein
MLRIGDTVIVRATSGWMDPQNRYAIVISCPSWFLGRYVVQYKIEWVDSGYIETFLRKRWRFQLHKVGCDE